MSRFQANMKKVLVFIFIFAAVFLVVPKYTMALQDCDSKEDNAKISCLQSNISELQSKITAAQNSAKTLQNAIDVFNDQIKLQQQKINQTIFEINQLEKEIAELTERLNGLSISLDRLSTILIERIQTQYKQSRTTPELSNLVSNSFNEILTKFKYLSIAQQQTASAMEKAEQQRLTYDEQKRIKEEKQKEVEEKRNLLQAQQNELNSQKAAKTQLLAETKNSEAVYQQKLAELNAQLASFSRYATSVGTSLLSDQTKCDSWGCYYSQRDSQWGNMYLPLSNYTIAQAGCLMTSVAMITTHYNKSLTPAQIASNSSPFASGGGLLYDINVNGVTVSRSSACGSSSCLDSVLGEGKPVIVKINAASVSGSHFLVILEKKDDKYIMHDPVLPNGNNKSFTDHYSLSSIVRVDRVSVY